MPRPKSETPCAVDGCGDFVVARGYCNKHWLRWWKHGAPTAGATYKGDVGTFIASVAKSLDVFECITWPFFIMENGYGQAKDGPAHRLVCEAAHGQPPSSEAVAAHLCGNGHLACVNPAHLRWSTQSQNQFDRKIHKSVRGPEAVRLVEAAREGVSHV